MSARINVALIVATMMARLYWWAMALRMARCAVPYSEAATLPVRGVDETDEPDTVLNAIAAAARAVS